MAALVVTVLASCSSPQPAGLELVATLVSPVDMALEWHGHEPDADGQVVEFATAPEGRFTILEFLPPDRTTYRHSDLMPHTPFYYRIRPVHGPATDWVRVHLPNGPASAQDGDWLAPHALPPGTAGTASIRNASTRPAAAPTDLVATVKGSDAIAFTWADHAADEEGYLIEVQPTGSRDVRVAMVLDPDITSVGLITLPDEHDASYRVRAFYYGRSSSVARQTTGG
jgi:hypothetical protein